MNASTWSRPSSFGGTRRRLILPTHVRKTSRRSFARPDSSRNKTKNIIGFARGVVELHDGVVPRTMVELNALPGVGRKTANVILGNAFGIDEGVVVDTHVKRLSGLLGFTSEKTPEKVERDLIELFPRERWTLLAHLLIFHGRRVCDARSPRCEACVLSGLCPSSRV